MTTRLERTGFYLVVAVCIHGAPAASPTELLYRGIFLLTFFADWFTTDWLRAKLAAWRRK